jgi:hypothetical protein
MLTPASVLLGQLADARRAGQTFEDAWEPAVAAALCSVADPREHSAWVKALAATREAWQRSYERRPCPRPELALRTVVEDRERELVIR